MKNYYEILGVEETATQDDIKKSYRKLSKQFHPDVNPQGEDRFKEISEAYENIGDEKKRQDYDVIRKNPFGNFGGGNSFDINSIFEQMMGGGNRQKPKAPDKVVEVLLTPLDSFFGVNKEIEFNTLQMCELCFGSGGEKSTCATCGGYGVITQIFGTGMFKQSIQMACSVCSGTGSIITKGCLNCSTTGQVPKKEKLSVGIPKNVDNGDFMRLRGKGDFNPKANNRGDVILKVNMDNNGDFEKIGMDLIYKKKISALDLLLNDKIEVDHPEGNLNLSKPDFLDTEKPLRIHNKGYKGDVNGNFYIKISVSNTKEDKDKLFSVLKQRTH